VVVVSAVVVSAVAMVGIVTVSPRCQCSVRFAWAGFDDHHLTATGLASRRVRPVGFGQAVSAGFAAVSARIRIRLR